MDEKIKEKAEYCLNCKAKPCSIKGCPLNNNIPEFIRYIKEEKCEEAYQTLTETTVLPSICGRICPHYKQCMGSCVRGIKGKPVDIGELEAFVGDMAIENGYKMKTKNLETEKVQNNNQDNKESENKKRNIAIIGGGPAGLTAAAFLAKKGHKVTIYEKYNYLGGLLVHGVPEFRLSRDVVAQSINQILKIGKNENNQNSLIEIRFNMQLGKNLNLKDLEKEYDNIILAFGANVSSKLGIEGEDLEGVYGGNELLEYRNYPDYNGKTIIVVGGGNVAMDTARTIKRLGAERVIVVYRRAKEQMPAEQKEIDEAIEEGVEFLFQNNIVRIIGKDKVEKVELIKTELVQKSGETRPVPVNIKDSNYEIEADCVVAAIGAHTDEFVQNLGLELDRYGNIKVNDDYQTANPKIYAIGDLAGIKSTVAWAARSGREVAKKINSLK